MKTMIYRVRTTTAGRYVANNWVAENALELYKEYITKTYGKKATVHNIEAHTLENGAEVMAYTVNGFRYGFKG